MLKRVRYGIAAALMAIASLGLAQQPTWLTPEVHQRLETLPIGQRFLVSEPRGDGCNTCARIVRRIDAQTVSEESGLICTTLICGYLAPVPLRLPLLGDDQKDSAHGKK